jgi:hypothetical protein
VCRVWHLAARRGLKFPPVLCYAVIAVSVNYVLRLVG